MTMEIVTHVAGNFTMQIGSGTASGNFLSPGVKVFVGNAATDTAVNFRGNSSANGSIDNVAVFRATNGIQVFSTTNANTVAAFVVTLKSGSSLVPPPKIIAYPALTNLLLHSRDLTNVVWVKTLCTAAKDAIGIDGGSSACSTLTATSGNATCLQTVTSGSAVHSAIFRIKRKTGTGTVNVTDNGGTNWTAVTINAVTWTEVVIQRTQANPVVGFQIVTSGDEIIVDANGLFSGPALEKIKRSSPIFTTSSTAEITATDLRAPIGLWNAAVQKSGVFHMKWTPHFLQETGVTRTLFSVHQSNGTVAYLRSGVVNEIRMFDGTTAISAVVPAWAIGQELLLSIAWGGNQMAMKVDSTWTSIVAYDGAWDIGTHLRLLEGLQIHAARDVRIYQAGSFVQAQALVDQLSP
jgi:hypothetical protein